MKADVNVYRSIVSLEDNQFWKIFVQWLKDSLHEQAIKNAYTLGEIAIKGQGKVLQLDELINHISKARENLRNIKKQEE